MRGRREKKRDVIGYVGVMLRLCAMLEVLMQKNETIGKFVETQAKEMEMAPEDLAIYREEEEKNVGVGKGRFADRVAGVSADGGVSDEPCAAAVDAAEPCQCGGV